MNTKAIVNAIEHAMEHTVNYPSLIEKIAYLDGLAAACEYMGTGKPLLPLKAQWQRIKECRSSYTDEIREQEIAKREEKALLLTTFPTDDGEESVFDVVPEELKEEVQVMDVGLDLVSDTNKTAQEFLDRMIDGGVCEEVKDDDLT